MSMNKNIVIIPTYNEIENIENIIDAVMNLNTIFDILIVDDNSPDGTAKVVKKLTKEHPKRIYLLNREKKLGLGTAYISGFKWALEKDYEHICEMDADFSHNPSDLEVLLNTCITQNADIAIGSRYINGVNVVNWSMDRILISYFASLYVRIITGMPLRDSTAGFVCYHQSVLRTIDLREVKFIGYAFQIEMKFNAWKHGFKIIEVPIIFTNRIKGKSKMSTHIFKEAVFGVIQMKISSLFKKYQPSHS